MMIAAAASRSSGVIVMASHLWNSTDRCGVDEPGVNRLADLLSADAAECGPEVQKHQVGVSVCLVDGVHRVPHERLALTSRGDVPKFLGELFADVLFRLASLA
ncbi:MAG: hypothetical protein WBA87_07925 [Microbacterium sp.]